MVELFNFLYNWLECIFEQLPQEKYTDGVFMRNHISENIFPLLSLMNNTLAESSISGSQTFSCKSYRHCFIVFWHLMLQRILMLTSALGGKLLFLIRMFGNFFALTLKLTEKLPNCIKLFFSLLLRSLVHGKDSVFRSVSF